MSKIYCSECVFIQGRFEGEYSCNNPFYCKCESNWLRRDGIIHYGKCEQLNKFNDCAGFKLPQPPVKP